MCLVDDAQWLDGATGQVLGFVARRLLAESVGDRLRGARTERRTRAGRPARVAASPGSTRTTPAPCWRPSSRADSMSCVRDRIIGETRGNPLALLELSRGMPAAQLAGGFAASEGDGRASSDRGPLSGSRPRSAPTTQQLMLLAAADPVGDAALLWRAAQTLGIERRAAEPAEADQLLEIGARGAVSSPAGEVSGLPRRVERRSPSGSRRPGGRHRPRGRSRSAGLAPGARRQRSGRGGGRRVAPSGEWGRAPRRYRCGRRVPGAGGDAHARTPAAGVTSAGRGRGEVRGWRLPGGRVAAGDRGRRPARRARSSPGGAHARPDRL